MFSGLFGGGYSIIPMILALVALVDCVRVGASWYWLWIILGFPVIGPLAYFVVVRSGALGGRQASLLSPYVARRLQARRRLRELEVQLAHWRGPGVLVEAGEQLLVLGKLQDAEKHFREAQQNGAMVEDVNFGLAQALVMQARWAEAVPLLEALIAVEPDSHLGEGPMLLGRSLDESGRRDEAEAVLRKVLERRAVIEAQVRLARILYQKGQKEEADRLVAEIATDAKVLPRYLKRRHRAWLRAARGLSATTRLPKPRIEGAFVPGEQLRLALMAGAGIIVALVLAWLWMSRGPHAGGDVQGFLQQMQQARSSLDALDRSHPWTGGDDLAKTDLTAAEVDGYLRLRRGVASAFADLARRRREWSQGRTGRDGFGEWMRIETSTLQSLAHELEREGMGPRTFENLIGIIDWRFLRRPEALGFGLPEYARDDWMDVHGVLGPRVTAGGGDSRRLGRLEKARAKAEGLKKQAEASLDLSPATRQVLETRRAELDKLDPGDLEEVLQALEGQSGDEGD